MARKPHPLIRASPKPHPQPQPLRIGAAGDLLRVPTAAADRAGAAQRSKRADAETAALLAPVQGRRPG